MPNALAVTVSPSAAVTASGASASVDVGTVRTLTQLQIVVTAVSGTTPSLTPTLETSADDASWETLDSAPAIVTTGTYSLIADRCKQYVRLAWAVSGTTPSFTFTAVGEAHTIYATQADMEMHAASADALEGATQTQQLKALLAASSVADDYLSSAYTMPLASWGAALSSHVARIAVYSLSMAVRHLFDEVVDEGNARALRYLRDIAEGRMRPATIVDATPAAEEDSAYIVSPALRGW